MTKVDGSTWKVVSQSLFTNRKQVLLVHLIYVVLGTIIFTPLVGIVGRGLVSLSGQAALSDFDILYYFLTPLGMVSSIIFSALLISIMVFEQASIMAVGVGRVQGRTVDVMQALSFTFVRIKTIVIYAVHLVARLLIIVLPFLAVSGVIGWLFLTEFDINYYLSEKPPAFLGAALAIGFVLLAMVFVLVGKLVGWLMTLPLVLLGGTSPGQSFSESDKLVGRDRGRLFFMFLIWMALVLLANIILLFFIDILGSNLIPRFNDSLSVMVIVLGFLVGLLFLGNFFITAFGAGSFGFLLLELSDAYGLSYERSKNAENVRFGFLNLSGLRLFYLLAGTIVLSVIVGFQLIDGVQADDHVSIVAHRGAAGRAPENTIASVRAAVEDGADWIEIDVQESLDGEIVVVHDSDLMKLAGVNTKIWDAHLEELKQVDVGSWYGHEFSAERIPTLREVLEEVRGKAHLLVELKYYGHDEQLEQRVVDIIEQTEMVADVAVMSLKVDGINKLHKLRPDWKVGLLLSKSIGSISNMNMDFLAVNGGTASPSFIRRVHNAGMQVYVWTINDQISMNRMMSLGVDGLITDEPGLARNVLADRRELNSVERLLLHTAVLLGQQIPQKMYRDQSP